MKNQPIPDRDFRRYPVPERFDVKNLVTETGSWLKNALDKTTELVKIPDGWLIKAKDKGGMLSRLVNRKAESLYVVIKTIDGILHVGVSDKEWKSRAREKSEKIPILKAAVSNTIKGTVDLADSAASGLLNVWRESETAEAVFAFVSHRIISGFQTAGQGNKFQVNSDLSRYIEPMSDVEAVWVASVSDPGEILIARLGTSTIAEETRIKWTFFLTTHKSILAAFSKNSLEKKMHLEGKTFVVTDSIGREKVSIGGISFRTQLQNDDLFREIAPLFELKPEKRLIEAARLNYIHGGKSEKCVEYACGVLDYVMTVSADPLNALSRYVINLYEPKSEKKKNPFDTFPVSSQFAEIAKKLVDSVNCEDLKDWADAWKLKPGEKISLSGHIGQLFPDSERAAELVSGMFEDGRRGFYESNKDRAPRLVIDIRYAENLISGNRPGEAEQILENLLKLLPDETLFDLLPGENSDLTLGEGGQILRIRVLEMLSRARGIKGNPDPEILRQLAILQPLSIERLADYCEAAKDGDRDRVSSLVNLLEAGGILTDPAENRKITVPLEGKKRTLTAEAVEQKLRHPASREGSILGKIQNFIATKKIPDHTALKSFAKRANMKDHPEILSAIVDGSLLLGLQSSEAFISEGEQNTGVRAYEGSPPFILIGSEHLDPGSPFFLSPPELRFLIGVELAHLRFGHMRISSREVWEGAFDKTIKIIEMFPIIGGYLGKITSLGKFAGKASNIAKRIGDMQQYVSQAQSVAASASDYYAKHATKPEPVDGGEDEQNVIGAFREMQLTADRTGLLLCGNIEAAVRAMFKSNAKLRVELPFAVKYGLGAFLSRRDTNGELMYQETAIRFAALFSFFLSKEFEQLQIPESYC